MTMGVIDDDTCPLCGSHPETRDHLFFMCEFSRQCVAAIRIWLGLSWSVQTIQDFHRKRRMPKAKRRFVDAVIGNLIYAIWHTRNEAVWHKRVTTVRRVVEAIKTDTKARFQSLTMSGPTSQWVRSL